MKAILVLFHCESNTGYAIGRLEQTFYQMALTLANGDSSRIHFAYPSMAKGKSPSLPADFDRCVVLDTDWKTPEDGARFQRYITQHNIDTVFGFDQPVRRPMYKYMRAGGVKHFISYWGAPISSIFNPLKQWVKRIEVSMQRHGPDHYIFESQGMADTAIRGRGIPPKRVHVVYLGADIEGFRPTPLDADYVYQTFAIPRQRRIFFYSGHMEPRKGVKIIMEAANVLAERRPKDDWHMLLLGNQPGQEDWLLQVLGDGKARQHVTFGGYRDDIQRLHRGCHAGMIASTGWDSLTMSAIEMQASGLPLILSNLAGLNEAIQDGATGLLVPPGDPHALARAAETLLDDTELHQRLAMQARQRVEKKFSTEIQLENLTSLVRRLRDHGRPGEARA